VCADEVSRIAACRAVTMWRLRLANIVDLFVGNGSVNGFPEQQIETQQCGSRVFPPCGPWQGVISKGQGYSLVISVQVVSVFISKPTSSLMSTGDFMFIFMALLRVWVTIDGGFDWWMDLLTTYTHDSDLQAVTAPPINSTASAKPFPACSVFTSHSLATASNN
jgi:hypothetical protein